MSESLAKARDTLGRPLRDLRISLTDRCNFRCTYCMPRSVFGPGYRFLPSAQLLTFDEIVEAAAAFIQLGVDKIRLTGGEPLLRPRIEQLVARLSALPGLSDLALTTNGALLDLKLARALRTAGLVRATVSLDALDDATFQAMNDAGCPVSRVLEAIQACHTVGLDPVKVNMVVRRGINEGAIVPMAAHFRGTGAIVRFIEYMDVGTTNGWRREEVVAAQEILERIGDHWALEPVGPRRAGEVARRYRYLDGGGEIGIIASVTQPFCGTCTRARLTPEGRLFTCLFASDGFDVRTLLRAGADRYRLTAALAEHWARRADRYSQLRERVAQSLPRVEMSRIGG